MGHDDANRRAILKRRASLLASSLAALSCGAGEPAEAVVPNPAQTVHSTAPPATAGTEASSVASSAAPSAPAPSAPVPAVAMVCLSIVIVPRVLFAQSSFVPAKASHPTMREAAKTLRDHPKARILIAGHSDAREPLYGVKIGLKRAEAVRAFLVAEGVDPARLCTKGFGDSRPLTAGKTVGERAKNRRVEFRLLRDDEDCP